MLFKPAQLGLARLDPAELAADRKACKKIGPCGVGKKALYLNSFYIDRRYYLPYTSITRVFKRVAMSAGGFTGKGMFASMAYLVVEYDGGKQKQCNFKDERDVDALLELLAKQQPQIRLLSAAGEQALQKKAEEKAARKLPELSEDGAQELSDVLGKTARGVMLRVVFYDKDHYETAEGLVSEFDPVFRSLCIVRRKIPFGDIYRAEILEGLDKSPG